jgi:hypothetical protein
MCAVGGGTVGVTSTNVVTFQIVPSLFAGVNASADMIVTSRRDGSGAVTWSGDTGVNNPASTELQVDLAEKLIAHSSRRSGNAGHA